MNYCLLTWLETPAIGIPDVIAIALLIYFVCKQPWLNGQLKIAIQILSLPLFYLLMAETGVDDSIIFSTFMVGTNWGIYRMCTGKEES